ncbi:hypothetical protein [Ulvibacter antarcticus]|uniref:Uncharacterized protein n=1 Tax=Ulvibacter antarcticus TaxID=442714 RepID=A0A3L9YVF6_9FLAO|nr:hypothetical protein [Ulvibacter antarcticus]RMA64304.1 hypothetical protein BXY75_1177 [Ulvibacter antarcticus]
MDYQLQEYLNQIRSAFSNYGVAERYRSDSAKDSDYEWGASHFFCKLFLKSKDSKHLITKADFDIFKFQYENKLKTKIDTDSLFKKFWLREIIGFVYVPQAIRSVVYDYEKYEDKKEELQFLRVLHGNHPSQTVGTSDLQKAYSSYNARHSCNLDSNWMETTNWIKFEKGTNLNKIGNIDYHFKLLDNWEVFAFLNAFKSERDRHAEGRLQISTSDLKAIIKDHSTYFKYTPKLESFIEEKTFTEDSTGYTLELFNSKVSYWSDLNGRISGHYWQSLLKDNSFKNDTERLKHFLVKVLGGSQWPEFKNQLTTNAQQVLLETVIELVNTEPDIIGTEDEFEKCYLDQRLSSQYAFQSNNPLPEEFFQKTDNLLERYRQLQHISEKNQHDIFYSQECRTDLAFLVKMVVELDKENDTVIENNISIHVHYYNVKQLLRAGLEKPYLLWETSHFIVSNNPKIIPYLLMEQDFASLGFHLLEAVKINSEDHYLKSYLKINTLSKSLKLILNSLLRISTKDNEQVALLVFQLFQDITRYKQDSVSRVRSIEERDRIISDRNEREHKLLSILENIPTSGELINTNVKRFLLPSIFKELITIIESKPDIAKRDNGYLSFPFIQLDILSWLSQILLKNVLASEGEKFDSFQFLISETFIKIYITKIEQNKVKRHDYKLDEIIETLPSWGENNERLDKVDWFSLALVLAGCGTLSEFLNPRFRLKKTIDIYDDDNEFTAKKIRTHLFILLTILKSIKNNHDILDEIRIKNLKIEIENKVIELVKKYGKPDLNHSVNILGKHLDRSQFRGLEDELLPFLIEMSDVFEDKKTIYDILLETDDLTQLLYLLSHTETKGVVDKTIEKIQKMDVHLYLENQKWPIETKFIVTELPKYPDLVEQSEVAFAYWKNLKINQNDRETSNSIFEAELIQAYYKGDEAAIEAIDNPEEGYASYKELKPYYHKQFFIALIRYKDNPESAYLIFNELVQLYPQYPTFVLNRFGAKINVGLKTNNIDDFIQALNEWLEYEKDCTSSLLDTIVEKVNYNKLTVYLKLKNKKAFESLFNTLSTTQKMAVDMVQLRVQMLVDNEFINEARVFLEKAVSFHKISDKGSLNFLKVLEDKIADSNPLDKIKNSFQEFSLMAKNSMSSVKPLKHSDDFGKQMTNELITASKRFLTNIKSLKPNANEDDYSAIIKEILENKLSTFHYHIKDQSKGGSSATGKNPGERDLIICDDTGEISVIEAFKLTSKTVVQTHITKIFNYTHMRNIFFILAYDLKPTQQFETRWKRYKTQTLKNLKYPLGYEIDTKDIWDATSYFKMENTAIKVCRSSHKNGTKIYHLVMNVKYLI